MASLFFWALSLRANLTTCPFRVAAACLLHSRYMRRCLLKLAVPALGVCAAAIAVRPLRAQPLPPAVLKLAAVRRQIVPELKRTGGMMCLETIERSSWDRHGKLTRSDRLQLEVAFAGSRELFAWPGDDYFSTETPADLAGAGLGSSGEFISHLSSVFNAPGASIRPASSGSPLLRYDYEVPLFGSAFTITGLTGSATVGSAGSFWADPDTLDIVRLENRAKDIPVQTSISEVVQIVDYARLVPAGGGAPRLTPQRATTATVAIDRSVHRNRIEFSHCREFGATSQLSFDDTRASAAAPPPPIAVPASIKTRLPARLAFRVRLDTELDLAKSHAGQPISAVLTGAIKHRGKQLAPAGATITGRLRWLERRDDQNGAWMIGLEFTTLGESIRFFATLDAIHDPTGQARLYSPARTRERIPVSRNVFADQSVLEIVREEESAEMLRLPGVGLFTLPAAAARLPSGLELSWISE